MLQWPYCSARRNGTIPQHNSLSSSISSHSLITKALSHSLLHIYSCVWVPVRVCVSFTSTSVHTHILSTSGKTCQKSYPSNRNPHVTSFTILKKKKVKWNGDDIWWHIPWYSYDIYILRQGISKEYHAITMEPFFVNARTAHSIAVAFYLALMFLKGARIRWVWCWALCVVIIHLFPGWNSIKCYYNSVILRVWQFHIYTAWLHLWKGLEKKESTLSILA